MVGNPLRPWVCTLGPGGDGCIAALQTSRGERVIRISRGVRWIYLARACELIAVTLRDQCLRQFLTSPRDAHPLIPLRDRRMVTRDELRGPRPNVALSRKAHTPSVRFRSNPQSRTAEKNRAWQT